MHIEHHYQWRVKNHLGRWITTRHHCTEEMIRRENPEAVAVEGSLIVREVPDTDEEYQQLVRQSTVQSVGYKNAPR